MKASQRIPKAIAVVGIVGIGIFYNLDDKSIFSVPFRHMTLKWENEPEKADKTIQATESQFFNFTKSMINTSIQQLISNI